MHRIVSLLIILPLFLSLLACGQGAALRSAQEVGETVRESSSLLSGSNESQSSKGAVKEISLAELSAMNKASNKGTASGTGTSAGPDLGVTKDITGLERVVLKGGNGKVLTQAMMNQRCRRYIIEGPFDLAGKGITMPYGSVLDRENGELRNGTLVMGQTRVTPIYGISKETRISKVKVTGEYYETLVDLWGVHEDPVFPWDTSAPKKVYVVDLKKFGITPGYQKKGVDGHYTDRQYDLMYQNGVGFTEAIQWAYKNGYDGIRFPKNDYCFTPRTVGEENPSGYCGQVLIQDIIKFDIDLGGGSYYNILDSSRKSKYYKAEGETYQQASYMFWMAMCINVQVHSGKLVGDRTIRDYTNSKERNQEQTYGIMVSAYCYDVRIHHIDFSCFMGDGVTMNQAGDYFKDYNAPYSPSGVKYVGLAEPMQYSLKEGDLKINPHSNSYCLVSDYLDFSGWYPTYFSIGKKLKELKLFSVNNNRGYTRIPNMYLNVDILTFNKKISTERPIRMIKSSYLDYFQLNNNETGIKFQFYYDEGVGKEGFKHNMAISDLITSDCIIEYCEIHDNHRGGISGGCNNTVIRNCKFSKNDKEINYQGHIIPLFLVGGTNYHIDYEDSYGKNLTIRKNTFDRAGNKNIGKILLGVLSFSFSDNRTDAGVYIYNNLTSDIQDNIFTSGSFGFSNWILSTDAKKQNDYGCKYLCRTVLFRNNSIETFKEFSPGIRTIYFLEGNTIRKR